MKIRLKVKRLQERLDELTDGDYSGKEIPIGRYETAVFMPWEQES